MPFDLTAILLGGFVASVVWFFVGSIFYVNPPVARLHRALIKSNIMKKWKSDKLFMASMYLEILVNAVLAAFVYSFLKPVLVGDWIVSGLTFGLIVILLAHIPDVLSKLIMMNIRRKLVAVDLVSGIVGSCIIGLILAFFI